MSSGRVIITLVWIKVIKWFGKKVQVVLKVPGEELYQTSNLTEKVFVRMGNESRVPPVEGSLF